MILVTIKLEFTRRQLHLHRKNSDSDFVSPFATERNNLCQHSQTGLPRLLWRGRGRHESHEVQASRFVDIDDPGRIHRGLQFCITEHVQLGMAKQESAEPSRPPDAMPMPLCASFGNGSRLRIDEDIV